MSVFEGRFKGRAAIVTGGASGLGKAAAARIIAEGGQVSLWDLNADSVASVAAATTVALPYTVGTPQAVAGPGRWATKVPTSAPRRKTLNWPPGGITVSRKRVS